MACYTRIRGDTNAVLNRLEAEANHNHPDHRLAVWYRVGCRRSTLSPAQADAVSGPWPPAPAVVAAGWETHLAKKPLPMRLPMSSHHRNQLKKRSLKRHK